MIIGLTGRNAGGKGETLEFMKKRSFIAYSLSDVLREELRQRKKAVTRENLTQIGRELRQKFGSTILAEKILKKIKNDCHYAVDSFRNPAEIAAFRKHGNFVLLAVKADARVRFERIKKRARESDPQTYQDFLDVENKELKSISLAGQDLSACEKLADYTLANNGSLDIFHRKLSALLTKLLFNAQRPDWDEYFMRIAQEVATRSNCMKRKVAAIIIKDKRIISTGYNGTPRGVKNCSEGGCPRCNSFAQAGTKLDECLCSHGEENAIVQAAYHGIALKDATLYSTFSPCLICSKMIINAGIKKVIYRKEYPLDKNSFSLFKQAGVSIKKIADK
ncbi:MAG: deaminase [Elusimicrobiota bacterium]